MTPRLAKELKLKVNKNFRGSVSLADRSQKSDVKGIAHANLVMGSENFLWEGMAFTLVNNWVCD